VPGKKWALKKKGLYLGFRCQARSGKKGVKQNKRKKKSESCIIKSSISLFVISFQPNRHFGFRENLNENLAF
jgi:hypothetical protein